jgi:hypothetical protein
MIINSDKTLLSTVDSIKNLYDKHKFLRITIKTGKDRSLDYNAISHVWYAQIANELKDDDALGWKCHCKLHFGVPLLRAEDAEFRECYDSSIKFLSYEQKLKVMKYLPVTSIMTNEQFGKYCKEMQSYFYDLDLHLEFVD